MTKMLFILLLVNIVLLFVFVRFDDKVWYIPIAMLADFAIIYYVGVKTK